LALETEAGKLCLLRDPKWRDIVSPADRDYIGELCEDLKERARVDSTNLFKQLTALAVGSLVTHEAGSDLNDHPELKELCRHLVEL